MTDNNLTPNLASNKTLQVVIRAGQGTLHFLCTDAEGKQTFHPYPVKSGMSLSANLREAFKEQPYLNCNLPQAKKIAKATLMISTPVILVPSEEYTEEDFDAETLYAGVMTGHKGEEKKATELPDIDSVGIFAVNRDLQMVISDNCEEVEVRNVMFPIWKHLYNRYFQAGQRRKLFAYFHDKVVDVCNFEQRRLRFANVFDAQHAHDALYYILYVWRQMGMDQKDDSIFIVGDIPHEEWLVNRLKTYIRNVHMINPVADLNRSALSQIEGMPFDMMIK